MGHVSRNIREQFYLPNDYTSRTTVMTDGQLLHENVVVRKPISTRLTAILTGTILLLPSSGTSLVTVCLGWQRGHVAKKKLKIISKQLQERGLQGRNLTPKEKLKAHLRYLLTQGVFMGLENGMGDVLASGLGDVSIDELRLSGGSEHQIAMAEAVLDGLQNNVEEVALVVTQVAEIVYDGAAEEDATSGGKEPSRIGEHGFIVDQDYVEGGARVMIQIAAVILIFCYLAEYAVLYFLCVS